MKNQIFRENSRAWGNEQKIYKRAQILQKANIWAVENLGVYKKRHVQKHTDAQVEIIRPLRHQTLGVEWCSVRGFSYKQHLTPL